MGTLNRMIRVGSAGFLVLALLTACADGDGAADGTDGTDGVSPSPGTEGVSPSPAATTESASPEPLESVVIGMTNESNVYLPHHLGVELGFFEEVGLDVEVQIISSSANLPAVASGELQFSDATGSAVRAAAQGLDVRMVECHNIRPSYILAIGPDMEDISDLEGGSLAVNEVAGDTAVYAGLLLEQNGVDPSSVSMVGLGFSSNRFAALMEGQTDAGIISAEQVVEGRPDGIQVVGGPADLPLGCSAGLVASTSTIEQNPELVTTYIRGLHATVEFMLANPEETAEVLADWLDMSPEDALTALDVAGMQDVLSTDQQDAEEAILGVLELSIETGAIEGEVEFSDVADLSLYP